jgi:type II secretory pathway component PulK
MEQVVTERTARRGYALLAVLILTMMLIVLVFYFSLDVIREVNTSANVRDDLNAAYLAQMGLVRGQVILRLDEELAYDSLNESWSRPLQWEGETWGLDEEMGGETPTPPNVAIVDEDRKFNLLTLVRGNEEQRKQAEEVLKRLINICRRQDERLKLEGQARRVRRLGDAGEANPDVLVRNLVRYLTERASDDTRDLDFTTAEGEGDVRSMRKQSPFEMLTLRELQQIEGWTQTLLRGPPRVSQEGEQDGRYDDDLRNRPYAELDHEERFELMRRDIEEADERSMDPQPIPLLPYLTLYSTGRININTAPREILLALDEKITWDAVEEIVRAREQARRDVHEAEESGRIPEPPRRGESAGGEEEDEDQASFRAADIAGYAAFVARVTGGESGQQGAIDGLDGETFSRIQRWFTVRSTVFTVDASAKSGKVTHAVRAIYRRLPPRQQPGQQPQEGQQPQAPQRSRGEVEWPDQPGARLILLFRDVLTE